MTSLLTCMTSIFLLLRCACMSVLFSEETHVLVLTDDPRHHHQTWDSTSSSSVVPSLHLLSSISTSQHSDSALLVCLVSGLSSPLQDILWWVDDTLVTPSSPMTTSEEGGAYSASSVWQVSAAEWRSKSTYWCGAVVEGRVHRQRRCPATSLDF